MPLAPPVSMRRSEIGITRLPDRAACWGPHDHPWHRLRADRYPFAGQNTWVQAADTAELQRAVGIAAHHHPAHFVHMRGEHHSMLTWRVRTPFANNQIADRVDREFLHMGGKFFSQDGPYLALLPRDPRALDSFSSSSSMAAVFGLRQSARTSGAGKSQAWLSSARAERSSGRSQIVSASSRALRSMSLRRPIRRACACCGPEPKSARSGCRLGDLHRPGVGTGVSGQNFVRIGDFVALGRADEQFSQYRVQVRPQANSRTATHRQGHFGGCPRCLCEGDIQGNATSGAT